MLVIFTTNITAKAYEDAINQGSRELLESSLSHFFKWRLRVSGAS